jgi:hypothetical protein
VKTETNTEPLAVLLRLSASYMFPRKKASSVLTTNPHHTTSRRSLSVVSCRSVKTRRTIAEKSSSRLHSDFGYVLSFSLKNSTQPRSHSRRVKAKLHRVPSIATNRAKRKPFETCRHRQRATKRSGKSSNEAEKLTIAEQNAQLSSDNFPLRSLK